MDLQELLDRAAIAEVLTRYTRAVDTGAWADLDEVFVPGASVDYTESGGIAEAYPEVRAWLSENLPAFAARRMHALHQVVVTFTGADAAQAAAYFHNPMVVSDGRGGERVVEVGGLYHHTMVRTPDGWRSRGLHEEVVWTRGFSGPGGEGA